MYILQNLTEEVDGVRSISLKVFVLELSNSLSAAKLFELSFQLLSCEIDLVFQRRMSFMFLKHHALEPDCTDQAY